MMMQTLPKALEYLSPALIAELWQSPRCFLQNVVIKWGGGEHPLSLLPVPSELDHKSIVAVAPSPSLDGNYMAICFNFLSHFFSTLQAEGRGGAAPLASEWLSYPFYQPGPIFTFRKLDMMLVYARGAVLCYAPYFAIMPIQYSQNNGVPRAI